MKMNKDEVCFFDNLLELYFERGEIFISGTQYFDNKDFINKLIEKDILYIEKDGIEKINSEPEMYEFFINKYYRGQKKVLIDEGKILYFNEDYIKKLAHDRLERKINKTGHDKIVYKLIKFLKNKKNKELYLSNFEIKTKYGITRPDLYVLENTEDVNKVIPICYEIKYSHNDFMSDVKKENKRTSYLEISEKLYYVCPKNVIKEEEIPKGCGLIYMDEFDNFEVIIEAKKNNEWKNNFNHNFLIRLIKSLNMAYKKIIINEKEKNNDVLKVSKSNIFESLLLDDHVLLSKKQVDILFKLLNRKEVTMRELGLFKEEYGVVLDFIGLGLLKLEQSNNIYVISFDKSLKFKPTDKLLTLLGEYNNIVDSYSLSMIDRESRDKFVYNEVCINGVLVFDNYSFNKTNNEKKINSIGYVNLDKDKNILDISKNESFLNERMQYCEKLAFSTKNKEIKKKDIPNDCSLFFDQYHFLKNSVPCSEIKRGKKRNLDEVNKQIFWELLKLEYEESIISFVLN